MKAMRGRIALQKHFVRNHSSCRFGFAKLWECALPARRVRAYSRRFLFLPLLFLQLLPDLIFFVANVA